MPSDRTASLPALATVWPMFITTRVSVLLVGYLGLLVLGCPPVAPCSTYENLLQTLPARWDAQWYVDIASHGYRWLGRTDVEQNIVFFPAFPLAMRALAPLLGGRHLLAGVVISLGAFFWALGYLYRLARQDVNHSTALTCVALLATYPFALFFGAVYTESLYLLCATAAFYHARRGEWARAAAWGFVIGLTRPNGFLISVPLAVIGSGPWIAASRPRLTRWLWGKDGQSPGRSGFSVSMLLAIMLPAAGPLAYSMFNYWLTGDPLAWVHAEQAWGRLVSGTPSSGGAASGWSLVQTLHDIAPSTPMELLDLAAGILMAGVILPVTSRFGLPYGLFVGLLLLLPLASGNSQSLGRYTSVIFPAFIWLGASIPPAQRAGWIVCFAMLQGFGAALFYSWRPFL